jgi:UDP-N-acetylmuramate dehydrogenase
MTIRENVPLSALTTLRVGGAASFVAECATEADVAEALTFAQERELPWRVLGGGSNVLAADEGFPGVVLLMQIPGISAIEEAAGVRVTAGAGVSWDALVDAVASKGLWGLENLAGIPGTVGAAPVQNIGAYGSEVKDTIIEVRTLDTSTGTIETIPNAACAFAYRDSRFKRDPSHIILSVSFLFSPHAGPKLSYADLARAQSEGADVSTPEAVGKAVRAIRARKFPDLSITGTAGSFFKNPVIPKDAYAALVSAHPGLPGYESADGVKIPLAFILDRVLSLRGYKEGNVALFEQQPLVLVAHDDATSREIDAFAHAIEMRVHDATSISIEREVRMFP